jgi:ADP-heptose:LPS heptosyltransferase
MKASGQHIVLIRLSSVGDIMLATPLLPVLRKHCPSARITWLADTGYTDLVRKNPFLDRVIEFDRRGRHWGPRGIARLATEVGKADWVIDLQHKLRTMVLVALLRPRRTSVLVKRRALDTLKAILRRDPISTNPHQIYRYLQVIVDSRSLHLSDDHRYIPAPRLWLDSVVLQETSDRMAAEAAGLPLLGIVVGSRHAVKRWPARHVARLAEIAFDAGLRPVMLGGEEDGEAIRMVAPVGGTSRALVMVGGSLIDRKSVV